MAILAGPILATLTLMLAYDAALVAVGAAFGFSVHWLGLAVLVVLMSLLEMLSAAFFLAMALKIKEINSFAALANGLNLPVLLLGGILLPISIGPEWLRLVAHVDPLYYAAGAARVLAAGRFAGAAVWRAYAVLAPLCAIVLVWAARALRTAVA